MQMFTLHIINIYGSSQDYIVSVSKATGAQITMVGRNYPVQERTNFLTRYYITFAIKYLHMMLLIAGTYGYLHF